MIVTAHADKMKIAAVNTLLTKRKSARNVLFRA